MARPKKEITLAEKVLKGEEVDYSDYTQKGLIECIEELAEKVNEKKGDIMTESQLRSIRNSLDNQVKKIDAVISKPIVSTTQAAQTTPNTPNTANTQNEANATTQP